jgi:hypothetical protein
MRYAILRQRTDDRAAILAGNMPHLRKYSQLHRRATCAQLFRQPFAIGYRKYFVTFAVNEQHRAIQGS